VKQALHGITHHATDAATSWLADRPARGAVAGVLITGGYAAIGAGLFASDPWLYGLPILQFASLVVPGVPFAVSVAISAGLLILGQWLGPELLRGYCGEIDHQGALLAILALTAGLINYSKIIAQKAALQSARSLSYDDSRLEALHKLNTMSSTDLRAVMNFALDEGIRLTLSDIGYLAFVNDDETVLEMYTWSKKAMESCAIQDKPIVYPLEKTGLWGEAVRQRKPVITNDYPAPNPLKKGCPAGHVAIRRHLNIPVFDGDRIVAVAGVGNKLQPYDESDVRQLALLMSGMWRHIVHEKLVTKLRVHQQELEQRVQQRTAELAEMNQSLRREVVERINAEELLRSEKERADRYFDLAGTIIIAVNSEGTIVRINQAGAQLLGQEADQLIQRRKLRDFLPEAERHSVVAQVRDIMRQRGEEPHTAEGHIIDHQGAQHLIRWHFTTVSDNDGKPLKLLFSGVDITDQRAAEEELRQSEERYRGLVDNLGIGVAVISPQMQVLAMNNKMREWNPTTNPADKPICYEAFNHPPGTEICSYCPTCHTLRDGSVHESTTKTPIGPDEFRHFRIVASPLRDEKNQIIAAIEMVEDVTERVHTEENQRTYLEDLEKLWLEQTRLSGELSSSLDNLAQSKRETEEALTKLTLAQASMVQSEKMASIGVLAAGIAHEINNPIGYVTSNLRELIKYAAKISDYLKVVQNLEQAVAAHDDAEAERVQRELVEKRTKLRLGFVLADLEKITQESLAGTSSVESIVKALKQYAHPDNENPVHLRLDEIIDNSVRIVWNQIKINTHFVRDYAQNIPQIYGYAGSLQQVFSNLIINASQAFTGQGQITARLRVEDGQVVAQIEDNGCGIKPEHLSRIFEPFFTTKDVGQGTGLGLSLVYDIIRKNKGSIHADSVVDRGTTFTMRFPAIVPAADIAELDP
jgi:PAS domain S-box-containing protein